MSVELVKEVWIELKRYINSVDLNESAETLVSLLIDNDVDPDDIRDLFKSDTHVKKALQGYLSDHPEEEDEEEDEDDYNEYEE